MAWNIALIKNEARIPGKNLEACEKELFEYSEMKYRCLWGGPETVFGPDGELEFDPDAYEHMDYLWDKEIQQILLKHGFNGRICFGDTEFWNKRFWGYDFRDGTVVRLTGEVVYKDAEE